MVGVRAADGATIDRGIALCSPRRIRTPATTCSNCSCTAGRWCCRWSSRAASRSPATASPGELGRRGALRPAEPGEFTERAFLNDKLDLAQAEAVADLIEASSEAAVLGAQASLSGAFSHAVRALVDQVIELRALVEATLDFPDEEIDFLEQSDARGRLARIFDATRDALDWRARSRARCCARA